MSAVHCPITTGQVTGHFKPLHQRTRAFCCPELWISTEFLSSALTTLFPAKLAPKADDSSRDPVPVALGGTPAVLFCALLPTPPNHVISLPLKLIKWQNSSRDADFRAAYPLRQPRASCIHFPRCTAKRIDAPTAQLNTGWITAEMNFNLSNYTECPKLLW